MKTASPSRLRFKYVARPCTVSHQLPDNSHCCSFHVALILHDPITFQDMREEDGCTWENNPPPPTSYSSFSISCHVRKASEGSEVMWETYEAGYFQAAESWSENDASHVNGMPTLQKTFSFLQALMCIMHEWKIWGFHLGSEYLRFVNTTVSTVAQRSSVCAFMVTLRNGSPSSQTCTPPSPPSPKHNAIIQGKWVNQQWNEHELIIPPNLLSVTLIQGSWILKRNLHSERCVSWIC